MRRGQEYLYLLPEKDIHIFLEWSVHFLLYLRSHTSFWGSDQKLVSNVQGFCYICVKSTIICRLSGYTEHSQWILRGATHVTGFPPGWPARLFWHCKFSMLLLSSTTVYLQKKELHKSLSTSETSWNDAPERCAACLWALIPSGFTCQFPEAVNILGFFFVPQWICLSSKPLNKWSE